MGAFQSAFNDTLVKAIDYFKKWNAGEAEKTLQTLGNIKAFLGYYSNDFQQGFEEFINNVAKLIPELANVETSLAQTIFKEIGYVVKDSTKIIYTEATGFAKIKADSNNLVISAIIKALNVTILKALDKVLVIQQNLINSLTKIADKVNVQPLTGSLSKINSELSKALAVGINSVDNPFHGGDMVHGNRFKTGSIKAGTNDNEDVISFAVESTYNANENLVPFQKFINDNKNRGLKIVNVEVEDESPEVEAYLQHQSTFNTLLQR